MVAAVCRRLPGEVPCGHPGGRSVHLLPPVLLHALSACTTARHMAATSVLEAVLGPADCLATAADRATAVVGCET